MLIKEGAKLVDDAADISGAGLDPQCLGRKKRHAAGRHKTSTAFVHMTFDPCAVDTLAGRSDLPVHEVNAALTELELAGVVAT